jgi:3-methyladenine DNA glycosylase AlkC
LTTLFKDVFNVASITQLATHITRQYPTFDTLGFIALASEGLASNELKARSQQITTALHRYLPADFKQACEILVHALAPVNPTNSPDYAGWTNNLTSDNGIGGWLVMPCADFVAHHGQAHFAQSMYTLHAMTQRFSAEFAIRHFLQAQASDTLAQLEQWLSDPSDHVRRLVSEGSRPLLPWGIRLQRFVDDPSETLLLLNQLKDDPSDYVRLSVANHLNDISKHHPKQLIHIAKSWHQPDDPTRTKLLKHASRTLIKAGDQDILRVFGYDNVGLTVCLSLSSHDVELGAGIELHVAITCDASPEHAEGKHPLMIDYVVEHQKANGTLSPKVFKWKNTQIAPQQTLSLSKLHAFKPITTRRYYAGEHRISLQINGQRYPAQRLTLHIPEGTQ